MNRALIYLTYIALIIFIFFLGRFSVIKYPIKISFVGNNIEDMIEIQDDTYLLDYKGNTTRIYKIDIDDALVIFWSYDCSYCIDFIIENSIKLDEKKVVFIPLDDDYKKLTLFLKKNNITNPQIVRFFGDSIAPLNAKGIDVVPQFWFIKNNKIENVIKGIKDIVIDDYIKK